VFISFNAEEEGLHGSAKYVTAPLYPLEHTKVINLDGVGAKEDMPMTVASSSSSDGDAKCAELIEEISSIAKSLNYSSKVEIDDSCDHASFAQYGVPAVSLGDLEAKIYHVPEDTIDNTGISNLKRDIDIVMHFIDTPSQQVIHTAVLQRGSGGIPGWITPHPYGSVYSNSTYDGGWQPTELVAEKDGIRTNSFIPLGARVTEKYTFGIDAGEMGISNSFNSILLKIIYQVTGNVPGTPILNISTNGAEGTPVAPSAAYSDASSTTYDYNITPYVKTASELEQLQVSFSAEGQTNGILGVDFVGIQVK
jgi:hypothetical protein